MRRRRRTSPFRRNVDRWGFARTLYAVAMMRLEAWFGLRVFRVRSRPLVETPSLPPLPAGWSVREVRDSELRALAQDPELDLAADFVDWASANSATMTAVFEHNAVVAYAFAIAGSAPAGDGVGVRVEHPYRYSFKSYTRPEHRGKRLSTYTSLCSDAAFVRRGFTHAISFAHTSNYASIQTETDKGNHAIGVAGYVAFRGLRFTFHSRGCRRVGFAFFPASGGAGG